jgi:chaperone BCS1
VRGVHDWSPLQSSFITALAGAVGMHICVLNLSNKQLDDESLTSRLMDAPAKSMILLEDVSTV